MGMSLPRLNYKSLSSFLDTLSHLLTHYLESEAPWGWLPYDEAQVTNPEIQSMKN